MNRFLLALAAFCLAGAAHSATLDFSGNVCSGSACTNTDLIDQDYGDITGVDVSYDADRDTPIFENVSYWDTGYETLSGVAYGANGGGGLAIVLLAQTGYDVVVRAFEIAPYLNRDVDTLVHVIDLTDGTFLVNDIYAPLSTAGVTPYSGSWNSTTGIQINLGPDAWNAGIDNVVYEAVVEDPSAAVPLPAGGALLVTGLLGLGIARRRKG